jgi:hypothetical protein
MAFMIGVVGAVLGIVGIFVGAMGLRARRAAVAAAGQTQRVI